MKELRKLLKKSAQLCEKQRWLPPLLTRIVIGVTFVQSGWGKLHHLDKVTKFFENLGIPAAHIQAPFVAATELVCGLLLLVGLGARLVSVPLSIIMVVALVTAKKDDITGVTDLFAIYEFLYIVMLGWIIVHGPGRVSIDSQIKN